MKKTLIILTLAAVVSSAWLGCERDKSKDAAYSYFVSYTVPTTNGSAEGYLVMQFNKPVTTVEELANAGVTIRATITNASANVILKAFTPLKAP